MDLSPVLKAKRITIVGNIAAGKTTLARKLSARLNIPITYIDAIQFNPDLTIANMTQTRAILNQVQSQDSWIIDGQGPLDMFENRFALADQIIFIDLPIYQNFILLTYRLFKNIFSPRSELPTGSSELNWKHIKKQYRTTWTIHKKMRPELIRMLNRKEFRPKLMTLTHLGVKI
jgi:adenylate kinase family enzyme